MLSPLKRVNPRPTASHIFVLILPNIDYRLGNQELILNPLWEIYKNDWKDYINHGQFFLYGGGVGGLGSELPCHKTSIRIFFIYFEFYFIFFRNLEKLIKLIT